MMLLLLQALAQADSVISAELRRFDIRELFTWQELLPRLLQVGIVLLLAFIAYGAVRLFIRQLIRREIEEEDPVVKRTREQRAQTLAGLLSNVAAIVIVIITTLTILGSFVDIGPVLASVGVLGLAISFGAQSLVKDVITGTFMLLEGQFAIGDVVRVGDVSGMVEKITLRTTVLRDLEGIVHIVPNGEITRVSNLTKSWSRSVIDVGVAYKEDVDRVIEVLKEIMGGMHQDAEWGPLILEEPQVLGVNNFADSAVEIRISVKTLPLKQWDIGRELRRRIKNRFDRDGIEIPFPHVSFYWGHDQLPPALGRGDVVRAAGSTGEAR